MILKKCGQAQTVIITDNITPIAAVILKYEINLFELHMFDNILLLSMQLLTFSPNSLILVTLNPPRSCIPF